MNRSLADPDSKTLVNTVQLSVPETLLSNSWKQCPNDQSLNSLSFTTVRAVTTSA